MIKEFVMARKLELSRGQQYISLLFWAFMITNTFMLNLREYVELSIWNYVIISIIGGAFIIFGVWVVGRLDVSRGFFSSERYYAGTKDPVMNETLENTKKILGKMKDDKCSCKDKG